MNIHKIWFLVVSVTTTMVAQQNVTVDFGQLGKATIPLAYQISLELERLSTVEQNGKLQSPMTADATSISYTELQVDSYPCAIMVGSEVMTMTSAGVVQRGTTAESIIVERRTPTTHEKGEPVLLLKYTARLDIIRQAIISRLAEVLDKFPTPEITTAKAEESAAQAKAQEAQKRFVITQ